MSSDSLSDYMSVYYGKSPAWPNTSQMRSATIASIFSSDEKATRVFLEHLSRECYSVSTLTACWNFTVRLEKNIPSMSPSMLALLKGHQKNIGNRLREEQYRTNMSLMSIIGPHL